MICPFKLFVIFFTRLVFILAYVLDDIQITLRGKQFISFNVPETMEVSSDITTVRFRTFQSSGLLFYVGQNPYRYALISWSCHIFKIYTNSMTKKYKIRIFFQILNCFMYVFLNILNWWFSVRNIIFLLNF